MAADFADQRLALAPVDVDVLVDNALQLIYFVLRPRPRAPHRSPLSWPLMALTGIPK